MVCILQDQHQIHKKKLHHTELLINIFQQILIELCLNQILGINCLSKMYQVYNDTFTFFNQWYDTFVM